MTTPDGTPTKGIVPRHKPQQQNKYPSRVNCPLRGGKVNLVCEAHRNDSQPIKIDQAWIEKKKSLLIPLLETNKSNELLFVDNDDFKHQENWKRSIMPGNLSQPYHMDDILLVASVWQKQVASLI